MKISPALSWSLWFRTSGGDARMCALAKALGDFEAGGTLTMLWETLLKVNQMPWEMW